jgi:hypothetical protein
VIVEDASDALNFNNLIISAKGATNPIVKKDTNVKFFTFLIIFLNMFELFVTKNIVLWRTINLGRPVIELTSKCEAGIMFN